RRFLGRLWLVALPALRSRVAHALPSDSEVLGETGAKLVATGSAAVDLDDTGVRGELTQEADAPPVYLLRRVGLVAEIGVLRLRVDRILCDGRAQRTKRVLADP